MDQTVVQPDYPKWVSKLLGFNFEIQFRASLENKATDALSRRPHAAQLAMLTTPAILDVEVEKWEVFDVSCNR